MLSQSAYLFAAKVLGFGLRLLLPIFLVRVMTKADIGAYNQFFLVETLLRTLFQMGVNQSQFFFVPRDRENAGGYFLNSLLLNALLFAVGYSLVGVFREQAADFLGMPILTLYFREIVIYGVLLMANVTAMTYLMASKHFKQAAFFEINMQVLASIATLGAAFYTRDLRTILVALIVSRGLSFLMVMAYIHFMHRGFRSKRYFFDIKQQVKYGLVLGVAGMLWTLLMRMHEVTVSKFYDLETYAVYAQGLKQIPILQFYSQSITSVALVHFAQLVKDDDWAGVQAYWNKILASLYGLGLPITLFFLVVAQPLVILMYTQDYAQAVPIFRINAIGWLFFLLNPALVLRAMDRNDMTLKIHLGIMVLLPVVLYAGMKSYGLVGIIIAHALMLIGGRVVTMLFLNRLAPVHLAIIPSRRDVGEFYRNGYRRVIEKLGRGLKR